MDEEEILNDPENNIKGKYMTVVEMGKMLGLKKTERYWLVKKNYFNSRYIGKQMYVEIESFEKWYQNQDWYQKITGEKPGEELRKESYSVSDIAELLGITADGVQYVISAKQIPSFIVGHQMRVKRSIFEEWVNSQERYRLSEKRDFDSVTERNSLLLPEAARRLHVSREQMYSIVRNQNYIGAEGLILIAEKWRISKKEFCKLRTRWQRRERKKNQDFPKDIQYLTREQAADFMGVRLSTVDNWLKAGKLIRIKVGRKVRIPIDDCLDIYINDEKRNYKWHQ